MKNLLLFTAIACFALMGCEQELTNLDDELLLEQRGASHFKNSINEPFPHSVLNACNGEIVELDGIIHAQIWGTITPQGTLHGNYHQNFSNIVGVGQTTGSIYNCVGAVNFKFETIPDEHTKLHVVQHLISKGDAPNFKLKIDFHFVINANGELTSFRLEIKETC